MPARQELGPTEIRTSLSLVITTTAWVASLLTVGFEFETEF